MKKAFIAILIIAVLGAGGYLAYDKFLNVKKIDQWDLIPESTVLLYESKDLVRVWNHTNEQPLWNSLKTFPGFELISNSFSMVDSLTGGQGSLDQLVKKEPFFASLHITSRDQFGFIFYVKLSGSQGLNTVQKVLDHFESGPGVKTSSHTYDNFTINELHTDDGRIFSYFFVRDYFVFSYTPILIEDVIRNLSDKNESNFRKNVQELFKIIKLENDEGNLYIDIDKIYLLLSVFYNHTPDELKDLVNFSDASFLDMKIRSNSVLFNGFTIDDGTQPEYLEIYASQAPGPRGIDNMVSNRTALFFHYYIEDPVRWVQDLNQYWQVNDIKKLTRASEFMNTYNYRPEEVLSWLGSEIALLNMEPIGNADPEKLVFIRSSDITEARNSLDRFAESLSLLKDDTVYHESYGEYEIGQLYVENFPSVLFGSLFSGFDQCFYMFHDNYVVLSTSIQALKNQVDDMESENVWGKSIKVNQFLDDLTLEEANLSLFVNSTRSWPIINSLLNEEWKSFFKEHEKSLKNMEMLSLQFSNVEDKFYTSLAISHRDTPVKSPDQNRFNSVQFTRLDSKVLTKPYVVRNHRDDSREVILQDSSLHLNLISKNGELLWDLPLEAKIVSDIKQVDFYNNGKLQYFFATEKSIHIVDRNGRYIEKYPVKTNLRIRTANIIDYNNSKNYRIVLSDDSGLQYLYNKEGYMLKGWDPLNVPGIQSLPLRHIRVRGKDCMIIEKEDGSIHITNRRGEYYRGFPLNLDNRLISPLYIEIGSGFSTTRLTTITEAGELISFNLNGDIVEKNQLIKPSEDTKFQLVVDGLKKNFIIARQELNRLTLLDRNGNELFEKSFSTSNELSVQYYNFNSSTEVIAVNDQVQEFTYVYDGQGNLYNEIPVESSDEIGLMYFENRELFNMYVNYENKTSILSFKKGE